MSDVDREERLRRRINSAIETALDHFCTELDRLERRDGYSIEEITKKLAEVDPTGDWLDAWNDYNEEEA